tara:strand:+ start:48 stop:962 length:915 start_codon:yes stop_codon:yes gene_type:complete
MKRFYTVTSVGLSTALLLSHTAIAKDEGKVTLDAEAGFVYDSHVSVDQLDLLASGGDSKWVFKAGGGYEHPFAEDGAINVGYKFSQSLYQDFNTFDLQSHTLNTGVKNKFGKVTVAGNYSYVNTKLGGNAFLDMHIVSPSISGFVAPNYFVRAGYNYYKKDFETANDRDANTNVFTVDGFYFFNKSKSYFTVGASYEDENATADPFDLSGYSLRAALQFPLDVVKDGGKVRFSYEYRDRNYDNITPSIAAIREETRSTLKANLEIPIYDHFAIVGEHKYVDRKSNFSSSNYTENVSSISLAYSF